MKKSKLLLSLLFLTSAVWLFAQEIRVEPNTSITLDAATTLDVSDGNLVLESDASGDASLIDFGSITYSGGGHAMVQRYLTEGKWHLISSPVANAQSGMFLGDYLQYHNETSNNWTDIASETYPLDVMQGFDVWSVEANPVTETFSGTTNTGTLNRSFTQNGQGWNLMGNPYPSSLDWDAVTIPTELNGAFWLFDPAIGANGDYVYYINGGGGANTTSQYIPSGQGFFVRATGGPGTLTLHNSDRAHSSQVFYKNTETEDESLLVLKVSGNEITTQTAIRFNENATPNIDRLYDVFKIMTDSPDVPVLFTRCENEMLAINTLPSIENNETVPMWFRAGMDGEYKISATQTETFNGTIPVYLKDIKTGMIQNLIENPEYSFNYKTGEDRSFMIYFRLPDSQEMAEKISIYAYRDILHVNFPAFTLSQLDFSARILIYDLSGRIILDKHTSDLNNEIQLSDKNGIYTVKAISDSGTTTGKVFMN